MYTIARLLKEEAGVAATEYAVLLAVVVVIVIVGLGQIMAGAWMDLVEAAQAAINFHAEDGNDD